MHFSFGQGDERKIFGVPTRGIYDIMNYDNMDAVTELDSTAGVSYCDTCFVARSPTIAKGLKRLASTPLECLDVENELADEDLGFED